MVKQELNPIFDQVIIFKKAPPVPWTKALELKVEVLDWDSASTRFKRQVHDGIFRPRGRSESGYESAGHAMLDITEDMFDTKISIDLHH